MLNILICTVGFLLFIICVLIGYIKRIKIDKIEAQELLGYDLWQLTQKKIIAENDIAILLDMKKMQKNKEEEEKRKRELKFSITSYPQIVSEHDYINILFTGINYFFKTIKYIDIWVTAYNSVGDKEEQSKQLKLIGPISDKESYKMSYERVWYSKVISSIKVNSCLITFIDNSVEDIPCSTENQQRIFYHDPLYI